MLEKVELFNLIGIVLTLGLVHKTSTVRGLSTASADIFRIRGVLHMQTSATFLCKKS